MAERGDRQWQELKRSCFPKGVAKHPNFDYASTGAAALVTLGTQSQAHFSNGCRVNGHKLELPVETLIPFFC